MGSDIAAQREWARQWKEAGPALAAERRKELRHLSDERALAASEALLSLVIPSTLSPRRRRWSGLVEQQALFHRRASP
jgi:protein-disulfide isomerase-like protein with CxxC motif